MTTCNNNLPPEIIEAILRRLPAKSLGRFKCVSKPWFSLISSPQFIKSHLHHNHHNNNNNNNKLIMLSETSSLYSVDISERSTSLDVDDISAAAKELRLSSIWWVEILGSCNGVVLARDEDDKIYLINPTTREILDIPISPVSLPIGYSGVMYGFGYDSSTDDYKVVSISYWYTRDSDMFVSIYSLRHNSWRKLQNSPYDHDRCETAVLVNENLHWLTSTRPRSIVAFSLANEEFREIVLPDSIDVGMSVLNNLGALGGKLVLYGSGLGYVFWFMEEYRVGEPWTKINIRGFHPGCVELMCLIEGSNGDIVLAEKDRVVIYSINERRCRDVRIIDAPNRFIWGGTYIETLESFKRFLTL